MKSIVVILLSLLLLSTQAIKKSEERAHYLSLSEGQLEAISDLIYNLANRIIEFQMLAKDGKSVFGFERNLGMLWQNPITCGVCHMGINTVDFVLGRDLIRVTLENIISYICSYSLKYEVCSGAVNEMGDVVVPQILDFLLSPSYACGRIGGFCSSHQWKTLDSSDYIQRILKDKPDFLKDNDFVNQQYRQINADPSPRKTVKVLHITDLHLDFEYKEGTNVHCDEPLCCREHNGLAPSPEDAAGKYGSYGD